jgi:hypothetical protein
MFIQGYGVMQNGQRNPLKDAQIKNDDIKFVVLRDWWSRMNPRSGVFDLAYLEIQAKRVQAAGKRIVLGPMTGDVAPKWILSPRSTWTSSGRSYSQCLLPWEPKVLDAYEKLIERLASEFNRDWPCWITGCTIASQEMHTNGVDKVKGYSTKKMELAWIRSVNIVQSHFTNCILSISGQAPVLKYLESVIQETKDLGKSRISYQHNSLGPQTSPAAAHEHRMRGLYEEGYNSGREMAQPGYTASIRYSAPYMHYCVLYPQDVGKPLPALAQPK